MILTDNFRMDLRAFYSQVVMGILDKNGKMKWIMFHIITAILSAQSQ